MPTLLALLLLIFVRYITSHHCTKHLLSDFQPQFLYTLYSTIETIIIMVRTYTMSLPPYSFTNSLPYLQASETPAYIISALTSIGGVTGYVRTGSVPSIAAGLTVGALVCIPVHLFPLTYLSPRLRLVLTHICQIVRPGRLPHLETPTIRCRTRLARIRHPSRQQYPSRHQDWKTSPGRSERSRRHRPVHIREGVPGKIERGRFVVENKKINKTNNVRGRYDLKRGQCSRERNIN